jgi:predicted RNA polymerase sigma factor
MVSKTPPKTRYQTRDTLAKALGAHVRTVAHWLAEGMPGAPGCYLLEDCEAWLVDRAREARRKRQKRQRGGLSPR